MIDNDTDLGSKVWPVRAYEATKVIKKEKLKGADYVSSYKGSQPTLDPKYWLEDDNIDSATKII